MCYSSVSLYLDSEEPLSLLQFHWPLPPPALRLQQRAMAIDRAMVVEKSFLEIKGWAVSMQRVLKCRLSASERAREWHTHDRALRSSSSSFGQLRWLYLYTELNDCTYNNNQTLNPKSNQNTDCQNSADNYDAGKTKDITLWSRRLVAIAIAIAVVAVDAVSDCCRCFGLAWIHQLLELHANFISTVGERASSFCCQDIGQYSSLWIQPAHNNNNNNNSM